MPLCIPLKDKTEMIRDKTLLSTVPHSTKKFQHNSAYSLQLPLLDSNETGGLIGI